MKLSFTKFCLPMALCALTISLLSCAQAKITIANNGKSTFTIVIPEEAPTSVEDAALELQKDIELATEAKLALQRDNHHVGTSIISLGNTQHAEKAGISSDDMADGAYRIITKNGNLYIIGIDTPDGGWTENNGVSSGTASGVYTFLEDYLGVRWLMPGELGRDVPAKSTFSIDAINRTEKPLFNYRRLPYTYYYADPSQHGTILDWHTHMRIGRRMSPVSISATHNWWKTINASNGGSRSTSVNTDAVKQLYKEHPEWFAMDDNGNRPYPVNKYAKLETTNQELVKWFAEQAIKNLKDSERPRFYSLSPSDGNLWSQSPESKALYDPSPPSKSDEETDAGEPGMSSLVLKWYHDVAQRVAKEYPQGKLTGYIYASFLYPPTKIKMKLPDNFTPIIATSIDYGYKLYRPQTQELYKTILGEWAKVAPENWYYYGIPNLKGRQDAHEVGNDNFPGTTGIITPAAPDILNLVFSTLLKNHIKGAYIYGANSWSNAAMANYIVAKMEWNPTLVAYDVQREWLQRA